MLLFFDQSSAHNAYANDALNARKMNVGPGGKQPRMHDTIIPTDNLLAHLRGQHQSMVFDSTHTDHPNGPKGMELILKERGLWDQLVSASKKKKPVGRCKTCKANTMEREKTLAQAQAALNEDPDAYASLGERIYAVHLAI